MRVLVAGATGVIGDRLAHATYRGRQSNRIRPRALSAPRNGILNPDKLSRLRPNTP